MTSPLRSGTPCWADLWTSDVEGSRRFYSELFGWEAGAPNSEFGGYFMFNRSGAPIAGAMGDMGDLAADDRWKVYLTVADAEKTLEAAASAGGQPFGPAMPVADLGTQAVLADPTGAPVGIWQPGTFSGFPLVGSAGAPSWFELHTRDHDAAVAFYREVFSCETSEMPQPHEMTYTLLEGAGGPVAGILDASGFLAEGASPQWWIYWEVEDARATSARAVELGGKVISGPDDTPFGTLVTVSDPAGAAFKLRSGAWMAT